MYSYSMILIIHCSKIIMSWHYTKFSLLLRILRPKLQSNSDRWHRLLISLGYCHLMDSTAMSTHPITRPPPPYHQASESEKTIIIRIIFLLFLMNIWKRKRKNKKTYYTYNIMDKTKHVTYMYMHTHIYTYIQTHIYTYTTYTQIYIHTQLHV